MSDINNKFVDFMNKSDFLFDEREVSIKTFNFVSEQYLAEIKRLQKQNDSMRKALEKVAYMGTDNAMGTDREYFMQRQLGNCIGIASEALATVKGE